MLIHVRFFLFKITRVYRSWSWICVFCRGTEMDACSLQRQQLSKTKETGDTELLDAVTEK